MTAIEKYVKNGVIVQMPRKLDDKRELFRYASDLFEVDRDYTEKEVNELLGKIYEDYALLRRYLIDFKLLNRDNDGAVYRKNQHNN